MGLVMMIIMIKMNNVDYNHDDHKKNINNHSDSNDDDED
jgi:hypothetical protein